MANFERFYMNLNSGTTDYSWVLRVFNFAIKSWCQMYQMYT